MVRKDISRVLRLAASLGFKSDSYDAERKDCMEAIDGASIRSDRREDPHGSRLCRMPIGMERSPSCLSIQEFRLVNK